MVTPTGSLLASSGLSECSLGDGAGADDVDAPWLAVALTFTPAPGGGTGGGAYWF